MRDKLDVRAIRSGITASAILIIAIYFGSGQLKHFDPALIAYTSATIFATFGIVYRYSVWLQKPPTALYWRRGWELFLRPSRIAGNLVKLAKLFMQYFVFQVFIGKRSHVRWAAHFLMAWGCLIAAAVTFPLVFGWVHFEADPTNPALYQSFVLGLHAGTFPANSLVGWVTFHILDFCAVAVITGMAFAFKRRMYDKGAMSVQTFSMDFLPLILLFAVSVTGLMLTASAIWMRGHSYSFLALLHAFSVILTLLYLPFGKFFHIFQRPAGLGVQFYKQEGRETEQAHCRNCTEPFASLLHVNDLKEVIKDLGIDQSQNGGFHYQEICPTCRRKLIALNQLEAIGGNGYL